MADVVRKSIVVKGNISYIYRLWANFENFPHFMNNFKSIVKTGPRTSHWVMDGPLGKELEWDAETIELEENKRIAWKSTSGDVNTRGEVDFREISMNETEVSLSMEYTPPGGMIGKAVGKLIHNPEKRIDENLQNFKEYAEGTLEPAGR